MRDHLLEHGLIMLAGVLLGEWLSETVLRPTPTLTWGFLVGAAALLAFVYVPRLQRLIGIRGPRATIRSWRLLGEQKRKWIIAERDSPTQVEQDAQLQRWWEMVRGPRHRLGWDQLAASALGEIDSTYRRRFEEAGYPLSHHPVTWKGLVLSQRKGAVIGWLNAKIDCLKAVEREL